VEVCARRDGGDGLGIINHVFWSSHDRVEAEQLWVSKTDACAWKASKHGGELSSDEEFYQRKTADLSTGPV